MKIYIRNMACESCKVVVKKALIKLKLHPVKVELGEAEIKENLSPEKKKALNNIINAVGLEIVENKSGILIERIKKAILQYISTETAPRHNLSDFLSKELNYDYNYLSNLFSEIEANTITAFANSVKMERAKEFLLFEEMSIAEIAVKMHYSNPAHFSAHFKKITGFPPSHFKRLKHARRKTIQEFGAKKP